MEYLARDLQPGVTYAVQIRSLSGDDTSEWSPVFKIVTASDSSIPGNVPLVTGSVVGSSFKLSWSSVTRNTDYTTIKDFKDYEITVINGASTAVHYSTSTSFLYTIEMNTQDWGSPVASLTFSIKARDTTNNTSPVGTTSSLANAVPANVSGVTAVSHSESIAVSWTGVADTDISAYRVYADVTSGFTPSPANLVYTGLTLSFNYPSTSTSAIYFKVTAVDVFGQESGTPGAANTTPTAIPVNDHDTYAFTYTGVITTITGSQKLYFEAPYTILSVRASVGTAPTGSSIIVDVKKNGTSIWSGAPANRPTIAATTFTSGAVTNMTTTGVTAGDYITVDIVQTGSTVAGADLVVTIRVTA